MKDNKIKDEFIELRAQGVSYDKIADKLKVSKQTLINWSREFQLEISNLRAIQLEALQEKYLLTAEKRIEFIGNILTALKKEAEKRDLSKLTIRELYELILKYSDKLEREIIPISFEELIEYDPLDLDRLMDKKYQKNEWSV